MDSNFLVWALLILIAIATIYIFGNRKNQALRFLYPGLLTFLLFTIIPILFSIYVGFTNLSTGHFLSLDRVHQMLGQELEIDRHQPEINFSLHTTTRSDQYLMLLPENKLIATIKLPPQKEEVRFKPFNPTKIKLASPLRPAAVFQLKEQLKNLVFIINENTKLKYYRPHLLAALSPRYQVLSGHRLKELSTNRKLTPNKELGFFTDQNGKIEAPGFYINIGPQNFLKIFTNQTIRNSFLSVAQWTLIWALMTVGLTFSAGMLLALLLNDGQLVMRPIYRILFILPYAIPFFISVLIFKGMLNKDFGVINQLLSTIGVSAIPWLDHPIWAKASVLLVNLWLGFPYMFLLLTGILQSIPPSVYEAATLDGASAWIKFRRITLPLTLSAVAPLLVGSFAFNLNNFVGIYLLTGGGPPLPGAVTPAGHTDILISYTYRLAFEGGRGQDFGLAAAIGLFIFVIIAILTLINFKLTGMVDDRQDEGGRA